MADTVTASKLRALIGQLGRIQGDGSIFYDVEIKDAKIGYGNTRVLIAPITGTGEAWVNRSRVRLDGDPPDDVAGDEGGNDEA